MKPTRKREIWHLKARDFDSGKAHAAQDWRFQMFFEYLRISPSYALATTCKDVGQLAKLLGDDQQAAAVWKTYMEVGNIFEILYREWWLRKGINLFGIHSDRPCVEAVQHIAASQPADELLAASYSELGKFISTSYKAQGMPNSLLVSIPLGMKQATIMRQLKLMLDAMSTTTGDLKSTYQLEKKVNCGTAPYIYEVSQT